MRSGAWTSLRPTPNRRDRSRTGREVVLGFDGSYNDDSTALVGCTLGTAAAPVRGRRLGETRATTSQTTGPCPATKSTPPSTGHERFNVVELAADPPDWHREIETWAERYPGTVTTEYRTNLRKFMARACAKLHSAAINQAVTHDGDPRLARHIHNAIVKETPEGAYITKEHRHSSRKIDLATAAIIAHDRATEQKPFESVYERRGFLTFGLGSIQPDHEPG